MPDTALPAPYATLLTFTRYVDRTGPAKAAYVFELRQRRAARAGFNPHGRFIKALKADIDAGTPGTHLTAAVGAVAPRWRPLYQALLPGALNYLESIVGSTRVRPREVIGTIGGLPVKINPQLGLRRPDGRLEAVRLCFDPEPLGREAVLATLHLMERYMPAVLPDATAVLVDLRHGQIHRPEPSVKTQHLTRWLEGEAAAFAAVWNAAAAA